MAVQTTTGGLAFVVQGPSPERVRLWGQFAGQVRSSEEMSIVSGAFESFWWECQVAFSFDSAAQLMQHGLLEYVVRWMDSLVFEALMAVEGWQRVLRQMASGESIPVFYQAGLQDANRHLEALGQLIQQVAFYGMTLCEQASLPVPEHLLAVGQSAMQG